MGLRVLHVAAEAHPLIKTGGLADVLGSLPAAQRALGADARLLLPGYPAVLKGAAPLEEVARLAPFAGAPEVRVLEGTLPGTSVPLFVADAPALFQRPGNPYTMDSGEEWPDNHRRFALLGRVAADVARSWPAEVVHAHDWHAGLAPAYLRAATQEPPACFTIHNLAYQGVFAAERYADTGLPERFFAVEGLEFYGAFSFMKAGLFYSDRITTVSPRYAREIMHPDFGMGLDGLLRHRAQVLHGILNGIDRTLWNPATDPYLAGAYDADRLEAKRANKRALQRDLGLVLAGGALLFGVVSRLSAQKGLDLALEALPALFGAGAQLALLGSGSDALERGFLALARRYPGHCGVRLGFDEGLAHRIVGGADALLVPSRFEPCGLTQLYGLRYGTLPVVRHTGGLADTVRALPDADASAAAAHAAADDANGFVFHPPTTPALTRALRQAQRAYAEPGVWRALMRNAMACDFGWERSARDYLTVYAHIATGR